MSSYVGRRKLDKVADDLLGTADNGMGSLKNIFGSKHHLNLKRRGYLEVRQTRQKATIIHNQQKQCPENISETGFKCVSLNARSVVTKKNELNIMVEDINPHMIGVTELWANKDITGAELELTGYVIFRRDRIGRKGGGDFNHGHIQWTSLESTGVRTKYF